MRNILVVAILMLGSAASAEGEHHHGHAMSEAVRATDTAATKAFKEADTRMHQDMAISYSNDVDVDFLRGMVPHHAGAIAMAKVALAHSKDPEVRRLAEEIVKAQVDEIAQMQAMLKQRESARNR
ncbi:DUF305 domain-containing protein [Methylobacterium sp. C25]|uniref:CopM family metallochaperone n=1 Tax=Methylobacterium sp. C25 TaxID=2721622 RepID=UPI001F46D709|nr:DUF305 domain-containing protein [Methylobacterium sp. C25]MCE4225465.1 DUF305 domain-containing protein [Methylobacterium sp. C25]